MIQHKQKAGKKVTHCNVGRADLSQCGHIPGREGEQDSAGRATFSSGSFFCLLIVRVAWKGRKSLSFLGGNWCLNRKAVECLWYFSGALVLVTQ